MSLKIEVVEKAAKDAGISPELRQKMIELLADLEAANEAETEKAPPVKKQFVILVSADSLRNSDAAKIGWVVQIPEEDGPHLTGQRILESAAHFNETKKGRLCPVQTVGEAMENVKAGIFKEHSVWVKTKQPVYVFKIENVLKGAPSVLPEDEE
jgi:hypothetical protein